MGCGLSKVNYRKRYQTLTANQHYQHRSHKMSQVPTQRPTPDPRYYQHQYHPTEVQHAPKLDYYHRQLQDIQRSSKDFESLQVAHQEHIARQMETNARRVGSLEQTTSRNKADSNGQKWIVYCEHRRLGDGYF